MAEIRHIGDDYRLRGMADHWFTRSGKSGSITVQWLEGGWYVTSPETEEDVKCIPKGVDLAEDAGPHEVEGTVSKYMIGTGDSPSYLHLDIGDDETTQSADMSAGSVASTDTAASKSKQSVESTNLAELSGSDKYVTVEAVVDSVFWINKDESNAPDIKGKLVDDSVKEGVIFVVEDGVNHPYLEEGRRFRFTGVKDYYYKKKGEVQVKISRRTTFTDLGTGSSSSHKEYSRSSSRSSLHSIATEKIGDEELTVSQEKQDSAVGKAKKRARKQGRDPAIDPRFQNNDDES